jgi:hypothetical protein
MPDPNERARQPFSTMTATLTVNNVSEMPLCSKLFGWFTPREFEVLSAWSLDVGFHSCRPLAFLHLFGCSSL